MSENTSLAPMVGGDIIATEELTIGSGIKAQRIKLVVGDRNVDGGDVSRANPAPVTPVNIATSFRDAFDHYSINEKWAQVVGTGDIIALDGNTAGVSYLVISKSPFDLGTTSSITTNSAFTVPIEFAMGVHLSQRVWGQEFAVELIDTGTPLTAVPDVAIATISQTTNVLSIGTATAHGYSVGDRFGVAGCLDSRANYPALVVASVPSSTSLTATGGPNGNLPSLTIAQQTSGTIYARPALSYAVDGASMVYENTTQNNGSYYVKDGSGDPMPSGATIGSNHSVTNGSAASTVLVSADYTYAFQPAGETRLQVTADRLQWIDNTIDGAGTNWTSRHTRTQAVPDPAKTYKLKFRATNLKGMTVPVAQIISSTKSASSTATVVCDRAHGLNVLDAVGIYGNRDQTNFVNTSPATVIGVSTTNVGLGGPDTLTVSYGASTTATTYGGLVVRANGGVIPSAMGFQTNAAQTATLTSGVLVLVGFNSWTPLTGDYVNLYGLRDSTAGASLGVDGVWRVRRVATTTIELEPIGSTVAPADFTVTNCGGAMIKRTDLRITFVRGFQFDRTRIEWAQKSSSDIAGGLPVNVVSGVTVSGGITEDAQSASNPVMMGGIVRSARAPTTLIAGDAARVTMTTEASLTIQAGAAVPLIDVASALRTTSANSGVISTPTGGAISGAIVVTTVQGTNPTLDLIMEESFDNGLVHWQTAWSAPRITATGQYPIPPMLVAGQRRWTWTIGGTATPGFTFAINSSTFTGAVPITKSLIDRAIVTSTLNSASASLFVEGCAVFSLLVLSGAITTTAAQYGIRLSHDNANWIDSGLTVTAVANLAAGGAVTTPFPARYAQAYIKSVGNGDVQTYAVLQASS